LFLIIYNESPFILFSHISNLIIIILWSVVSVVFIYHNLFLIKSTTNQNQLISQSLDRGVVITTSSWSPWQQGRSECRTRDGWEKLHTSYRPPENPKHRKNKEKFHFMHHHILLLDIYFVLILAVLTILGKRLNSREAWPAWGK